MSIESPVIVKDQPLHASEDFYQLRRKGIGFIEELGSRQWTDYNAHDPGITILEALCYSITDLAYRAGWDIKDLLTSVDNSINPHLWKAFYTAKTILTTNPVTPDDYRRLLIDLPAIRNAWLICKSCSCDLHFYGWCEDNMLKYAYQKPPGILPEPVPVSPKGLYEVLLELERDPVLGDLNDLKIEKTFTLFDSDGKAHQGCIEVRFPEWGLEKWNEWKNFLGANDAFEQKAGESVTIDIINTPSLIFKDINTLSDLDFKRNWRNPFSASFEIVLLPGGATIQIFNASIRVFGDETIKSQTSRTDILHQLVENFPDGFIHVYRRKLLLIEAAVEAAYRKLQRHRNLDEDYCIIRAIRVEDIAVCADIEVEPNADIEWIQAKIWLEIEKYFNPAIRFFTLDEMLNDKIPVETIFNGPALDNGFIKADNLAKADLKKVLRVSDIINELKDIPGIVAINNLMLTKYDEMGDVIMGSADPVFVNNIPQFDINKVSARWLMYLREQHQPRLYRRASSFLFFKNGLSFTPRMTEVLDTYTELAGMEDRPKPLGARTDLPIPEGTFRDPGAYFPVQHNFPQVYGIGPAGLPSHVTETRRAEAKQLKGYLIMFEQLLANAMQQVAESGELFSLDPDNDKTYFRLPFTDDIIAGFSSLRKNGYATALRNITEKEPEFHRRRNQMLNHLLARFGENVEEYALLLTRWHGERISQTELIRDKINLLAAYPRISGGRYRAINYADRAIAPDNTSGLHDRILVLLGNPLLHFTWNTHEASPGVFEIQQFNLLDSLDIKWLECTKLFTSSSPAGVEHVAYQQLLRLLADPAKYTITPQGQQFEVAVLDETNNEFGKRPEFFKKLEDALGFINEMIAWSIHARSIVVEHLLLRPKFPGDAIYPGCMEGACMTCGEEDPFSFRLTMVMPGWAEPYNVNLDMRGFADRTIREQVPSHLVPKICWVGNEAFIPNPCDPVIDELKSLIINHSVKPSGDPPTELQACTCSTSAYALYASAFSEWYADKTILYVDEVALRNALQVEFDAVDLSGLDCQSNVAVIRQEMQAILINYFLNIVRQGSQFEKFEAAWYAWLEANEKMNWPEEQLHDHVEAILAYNLDDKAQAAQLCSCADFILSQYGTSFYAWMESNIQSGVAFEDFTAFNPALINLCNDNGIGFKPNTLTKIELLLENRYANYAEVSYRLWVVVHLLAQLRNTYPGATLHDCDDGADDNPVRLGLTALGNYPLKKSGNRPLRIVREPVTIGRFATMSSLASSPTTTRSAIKSVATGKKKATTSKAKPTSVPKENTRRERTTKQVATGKKNAASAKRKAAATKKKTTRKPAKKSVAARKKKLTTVKRTSSSTSKETTKRKNTTKPTLRNSRVAKRRKPE